MVKSHSGFIFILMTPNKNALTILSKDPVMKRIIKTTTLPKITPSKGIFKDLVRTIVFQQLSGHVAMTIYNRLKVVFGGARYKPTDILNKTHDELRSAGLSNQKANYIRNVAEYFNSPRINWKSMADDEIITKLTSIKGVGTWTAKIVLMFSFGREDVFPIKDLTIRETIIEEYGLKGSERERLKKVEKIAEKWIPHRTLASRYLWASRS